MADNPYNSNTFIRLTALWAFVESGLGGILHAFHLPFTGIVLGGFAVIIISLLAQCYQNSFAKIIAATLTVLAIKIIANPATSPMAYIAVGFQGFLGASLYAIKRNNFLIHLVFATLSMVESAIQKLLIMTLVFGKTFWQGIQGLLESMAKIFHTTIQNNYINNLLFIYVGLFAIWGIILAIWIYRLPQQIQMRKHLYADLKLDNLATVEKKKKNKFEILLYAIIFFAIVSFFIPKQSGVTNAIIYLVRTIAIIGLWQLLLAPIIQKYLHNWALKHTQKNELYTNVQNALPEISNSINAIWNLLKPKFKGFALVKELILGLIIIAIQGTQKNTTLKV